jgi:hypothetical protein
MPDKKTTQFVPGGALTGSEKVGLVQGGINIVKDLSALATYLLTATSIVPANLPYRGARVRLSADFSPPTSSFSIVSFGVEDRDTDNIWSSGQPTRLVVPAGVTKVRLAAFVRSPNGASGRYIFFKKNGGFFHGGGGIGSSGVSYDANIVSSVLDVVAGDYFELELFGTTEIVGAGLTGFVGLGTWFEMTVVEYT